MRVLLPAPPHRQDRRGVLTPWVVLRFTWPIWAPLPPLCVAAVVVAIVCSVHVGTLVWFWGAAAVTVANLGYAAMTFPGLWLKRPTPWERIQLRHGRVPPK